MRRATLHLYSKFSSTRNHAQHEERKKNLKQSLKARERNRSVKTELKSTIKKVRGATSADEGGKVFVLAQTKLDRAAARGIIHKTKQLG